MNEKERQQLMGLVSKVKRENYSGGAGDEECFRCGKRLYWSVSSYNGHAQVQCETKNCIFLME